MRYGVANRCGRPDKEEISRVLYAAAELGVSMLDTAPGYGDVEKMLGSFGERIDGFRIITKTPRPEGSHAMGDGRRGIAAALDRSLRDLGRDKVYGLLIHHPDDATGPRSGELLAVLSHLKADGLVENIGLSVYGPADIDGFLDAGIHAEPAGRRHLVRGVSGENYEAFGKPLGDDAAPRPRKNGDDLEGEILADGLADKIGGGGIVDLAPRRQPHNAEAP